MLRQGMELARIRDAASFCDTSSPALESQNMRTQDPRLRLLAPPPGLSSAGSGGLGGLSAATGFGFSGLSGADFLDGGAAGGSNQNQQHDWQCSSDALPEARSGPTPKRLQGVQTLTTATEPLQNQWEELAAGALQNVQEQHMLTVMVRNIACRYSQDDCATFLDEAGFVGKYDYIYLPMNATRRANLGYVFVNMTDREYVLELQNRLSGTVFGRSQSVKRCEITWANIQGAVNLAWHSHGSGTRIRAPVRRSAPIHSARHSHSGRAAIRAPIRTPITELGPTFSV